MGVSFLCLLQQAAFRFWFTKGYAYLLPISTLFNYSSGEFKNGSVYQYFDVPEVVYQELMSAASVGTYLNQNSKNSYRYAQI